MKKIIVSLIALVSIAAISFPSKPADAQVIILSPYCCDGANVRRCVMDASYPIGGTCYCNYQGWGHVC